MCIFDTACGTSFNKEKTPLKHANQFALFLVKALCPNTSKYWFRRFKAGDFDVSWLTDHALGLRKNWKPIICKDYWMKIHYRRKKNSRNGWELIEQSFQDNCMRWKKYRSSKSGYRMNSPKTALLNTYISLLARWHVVDCGIVTNDEKWITTCTTILNVCIHR